MVHADDQHGISRAALDQLRPLLQGNQPRHAGDGHALDRAARAVRRRQVRREQVPLQMPARRRGTRTVISEAFERLEVGLGGRKHQADAFGGNPRENFARLLPAPPPTRAWRVARRDRHSRHCPARPRQPCGIGTAHDETVPRAASRWRSSASPNAGLHTPAGGGDGAATGNDNSAGAAHAYSVNSPEASRRPSHETTPCNQQHGAEPFEFTHFDLQRAIQAAGVIRCEIGTPPPACRRAMDRRVSARRARFAWAAATVWATHSTSAVSETKPPATAKWPAGNRRSRRRSCRRSGSAR